MEDLIKRSGKLVVLWKRNIYTITRNKVGYKPTDIQTLLTHIHLHLTSGSESWLLYNEIMLFLADIPVMVTPL